MSALPTIQIQFTPQAEAALASVKGIPQRALQGIARGMNLANPITVGVIQKNFLNFPREGPTVPHGLRHQTGHLFRSIRASKAVITGDTVVSSIGSNIKYAGVHEFGFRGTVMVGGHIRKRHVNKSFVGAEKKRVGPDGETRRSVQKRVRVGDVTVGPHARRVNFPARAPIRGGIVRNLEYTRNVVSTEVIKAINGKGGAK